MKERVTYLALMALNAIGGALNLAIGNYVIGLLNMAVLSWMAFVWRFRP